MLKSAYDKNFIMTAGSDDLSYGWGDAFISKIGLAGSHAYSLLAVYELIYENNGWRRRIGGEKGKIEKLVKLRNPWGKGEWNGKWSDHDKRWN